jgi:cysteine desulfurase
VIYLDHNATTPVAPEVFEAMAPYLTSEWGNPSSSYRFGAKLRAAVEKAREQVAGLIGSYAGEILFTSCATESNNAAIHAALKAKPGKKHLVTSAVEHSSVLGYCKALEVEGFRVTYLPVDREGLLKLADLEAAISDETAVVSAMWANNETGVLFPVKEIGEICRARGVLFHCDAVQVVGKLVVDVGEVAVDYLSVTAHKFNGPKGIGALYVNRRVPFSSYIYGGHQERGRRGGTENVALIAGMGVAAELAQGNVAAYEVRVKPLRDALEKGILTSIGGTELNGHPGVRLANTSNITFHGVESEALLLLLDEEGICASSGSACLADSDEPSHVVKAMKPDSGASRHMIRFSLDVETTEQDVLRALDLTWQAAAALRS